MCAPIYALPGSGLSQTKLGTGRRAAFSFDSNLHCAGSSTLTILWTQQRCSRASGKTSRKAPQKPSAPSPNSALDYRCGRQSASPALSTATFAGFEMRVSFRCSFSSGNIAGFARLRIWARFRRFDLTGHQIG
jgi:hypothetical protein